jgi:2-dehydropantoate 2-reductase
VASIAVIGPGAIGATLAAWLDRAGHAVTVCARTPVERLRIEAPAGLVEATPAVLTDPAAAEPVEWVVATTKAYDSAACLLWLTRLVGPETRVAVVQNGVEHRARFAGQVPGERVVPVIAYLPAERRAPGEVLQREDGRLVVPDDEAGRAFAALFAATPIAVEPVADWLSVAWRKLALNAAGAVNALTLRAAEVNHDPALGEAIRDLVAEVLAVGRAEGAMLPDDLPEQILAHMRAEAPDGVNSIHADRLAGRPMEVDARNGVIVRRGAAHGIATPVNRMVVALLGVMGEPR